MLCIVFPETKKDNKRPKVKFTCAQRGSTQRGNCHQSTCWSRRWEVHSRKFGKCINLQEQSSQQTSTRV